MNELINTFGQTGTTQSFDQISISIASPEAIKSWSFGEIRKPETAHCLYSGWLMNQIRRKELRRLEGTS